MATPSEAIFSRLAVSHRLLTNTQIQECIQLQQQFARQGMSLTLPEVFQRKSYLTPDQVKFLQYACRYVEARREDMLLGQIAVEAGYVKQAQILKCLGEQETRYGQRAEVPRLAPLLLREAFVTQEQANDLKQRRLKVPVSRIQQIFASANASPEALAGPPPEGAPLLMPARTVEASGKVRAASAAAGTPSSGAFVIDLESIPKVAPPPPAAATTRLVRQPGGQPSSAPAASAAPPKSAAWPAKTVPVGAKTAPGVAAKAAAATAGAMASASAAAKAPAAPKPTPRPVAKIVAGGKLFQLTGCEILQRTAAAPGAAGNVHVVEVRGSLDSSNIPAVEKFLEELVAGATKKVILHFEKLQFLSSGGIGMLLSLSGAARQGQGDVRLCHVPQKIMKVIELMGLDKQVQVLESEAVALQSFGAAAQ